MNINMNKGISPLVATVLLIAFVVAVAGIIATWATGFTKDQTTLVQDQSTNQITCGYGKIALDDVKFASDSTTLSGIIENNGQIALGNMRVSVIYQNATSQTINLCDGVSGSVECSTANLTLTTAEQSTFNVTLWGANYDEIKISTNCTAASDTVERGDVN